MLGSDIKTKKVNKNVLCVLRNRIIGKFSYMKRLEKLYLFFLVFHLSLYGCQQMEPTASSSAIQDSATQTPPLVDQQISLNQVLDQEWILELITENGQGKKPVADTEVTLRFSAEKLTGSDFRICLS